MIKNGTGGANTNLNGLKFEKDKSLNQLLVEKKFQVSDDELIDLKYTSKIFLQEKLIGYTTRKKSFYKLLEHLFNISYDELLNINSVSLQPDNVFFNLLTNTFYIIEYKFQSGTGSVDEKPQTVPFKMERYNEVLWYIKDNTDYKDISFQFIYVFNDFWDSPKYVDLFKYINKSGAHYFIEELPLWILSLEFDILNIK